MKELDEQERKIIRELIRNPRISDNQLSKNAKIPVMTVNRKRKKLESSGLIRYFTSLDTGLFGTGKYTSKQAYILKFQMGITREKFTEKVEQDKKFLSFSSKHISLSYLGEKDGQLAYLVVLDAKSTSSMMDDFNGILVPFLKSQLGEGCIQEITTMRITNTLRRHHNYNPRMNMENGIIKENWPNEYIFVDEE